MAADGIKGVRGSLERHFRQDIWAKEAAVGGARARIHALSRMVYMVVTGFLADHCIIRASALTFTTILSIVPLLAVAFSIAKGFGLQNADSIRNFLMGVSAGRSEVVEKILQYIGNTNVKTLGWIGVGTLLVTVFTTVGNVERAFNTIWGVTRGRSSWRKFTDFFSLIVICPIIALVATSFTVMVQKIEMVHEFMRDPGYDGMEKLLLKFFSLALVWLGFTFAYSFVPNTRVKLKAALVGGVVAGSLWQSAQWFYIHWQIGFTKYNAIYGSFAQLPLFLVWLYISWIIVLLGAEVSYAVQHVHAFVRRGLTESLSPASQQKVTVAALRRIAARFSAGLPPETVPQAARELALPEDAVREGLATLTDIGIVTPTAGEEEPGFVLAVAAENIRMAEVLLAVQNCGDGGSCGILLGQDDQVEALLDGMARSLRESPANISLEEFSRPLVEELRRVQAQAAPVQ
jgi:membrane protein